MTEFTNSKAELPYHYRPGKSTDPFALGFVLLLHVCATFVFMPPKEALRPEPLYYTDHPLHTHRVYVYRQALLESGLPWGYDPAVAAGMSVDPNMDVGAKPLQIFGVLLPFLAPGQVVRLFLFLAVLTMPLWMLLACRRLKIPAGIQFWVMITLLIPAWLIDGFIQFFRWGLVSFATASYFLSFVLALFLNYLERPNVKAYLAFCFAGSLLLLLHILGPVVILPALVLYTLTARSLTWRWRTLTMLSPVLILLPNAFWLVPLLAARSMPRPPWPPIPELVSSAHLTYTSLPQIIEDISAFRLIMAICGLILTIYGSIVLKRHVGHRAAVSYVLSAAFALLLFFCGSFVPVAVKMQPIRFSLPAFVLLTLPIGVALSAIFDRTRLPFLRSAAVLVFFVAVGAFLLGKTDSMPLPPSPDPLAEFVAKHTKEQDRLLIQSEDGYRWRGYESRVFPLILRREIIGCTFPKVYNPAQFLRETLWGRHLSNWTPGQLRLALERWGVAWVFTQTEEALMLVTQTISTPRQPVGKYHAFRVPSSSDRFLVGSGVILAKVNRIELKDLKPEDGLIVLRYRFHPAWETTVDLPVHQYRVPEDASGFIALRDPPSEIILRFNPWKMLRVAWPQ